jgi:hypothetical protein
MKSSKQLLVAIATFFLLYDAAFASQTLAAAQTAKAKRQCISYCRARYRDCLHKGQLPLFDCRGVYEDCTQYSCTGLGPG